MDKIDIYHNAAGYVDVTAFEAIKAVRKVEKARMKEEENKMDIFKGDVIRADLNNGTERAFIVLSVHEKFSQVLMLSEKEDLPYAVNCGCMMYTHPGMINYVFNNKFTTLIRTLKEDEFEDLMEQVAQYIGIQANPKGKEIVEKVVERVVEVPVEKNNDTAELTAAKAERDVYKGLYESLLKEMLGGR